MVAKPCIILFKLRYLLTVGFVFSVLKCNMPICINKLIAIICIIQEEFSGEILHRLAMMIVH